MRTALLDRATRTRRVSAIRIPAPVEGWDTSDSLADMKPKRAIVMDNFFPQAEHIEIRRGHVSHASMFGVTLPVESLMPYHGVFASKLFAAAGPNIYDVTQPPANRRIDDPVMTDMVSGRFQYVNFANTGGSWLWVCNGAVGPIYYDGADWSPALLTGVVPESIIGVEVYKGRIWVVLEDSTAVGYLPVDSIQGAVETYELGGVMSKGGTILAVATWSVDGGDGPDDQIVFITSRGQVIVFRGLDPEDAANWTIVGVYDIGTPIGRRCVTKVGADLAVICIDGVKPLSQVIGLNLARQESAAVTQRISRAISDAARIYSEQFGWQMIVYPRGTAIYLNVPLIEGEISHQYVMNVNTGAWCRFTGQNASCWAVFQDRLFFGGKNGMVFEADVAGADVSGPIVGDLKTSFQYGGSRTTLKRYTMAQPFLNADEGINIAIGVDTDFQEGREVRPIPSTTRPTARWGTAVWGTDEWAPAITNRLDWIPITGIGQCAAIRLRVEIGEIGDLSRWGEAVWGEDTWSRPGREATLFEINGFNITAEAGGIL